MSMMKDCSISLDESEEEEPYLPIMEIHCQEEET